MKDTFIYKSQEQKNVWFIEALNYEKKSEIFLSGKCRM